MEECKICKIQVLDSTVACQTCGYPTTGTSEEKSSFTAKLVMQKSDVLESISRLKKSRYLLFSLGVYYIIIPFAFLPEMSPTIVYQLNIGLGLTFMGFGFLAFKKPLIALGIPLALTVLYFLILLLIDISYIWNGLIWKMLVLVGLGYGFFSVRKAEKILKENKYVALVLGFGKITDAL
jgi:hypothetical protein